MLSQALVNGGYHRYLDLRIGPSSCREVQSRASPGKVDQMGVNISLQVECLVLEGMHFPWAD